MSKGMNSQKYHSIPQDEDAEFYKAQVLARGGGRVDHARWALPLFVATTIFFATLSAFLGIKLNDVHQEGSFKRGFDHELRAAKAIIRVDDRMFEGSPRFRNDGTEFVPEPADGRSRPQYVGEPSKEIDDAWDVLHQGTYKEIKR